MDILKSVETIGNTIDKLTESKQDRQKILFEKHKLDMTSPFMLPQLIRPIAFIWGMLCYSFALVYGLTKGEIAGLEAIAATGGIVGIMIGYYFKSRKDEKINAKKTDAAIKIEEIKTKTSIAREMMQIREDRRKQRTADRLSRRQKDKDEIK